MEKSQMRDDSANKRIFWLLTLAVILYFFANFQRTVVPGSIFSELQSDLDVSAAAITALGSVFMYVYAFSQLFAGILADKFGGIRVMVIGGALFCFGSLMFPFSQSLPLLYTSRFIVGVGASSIYLSMVKEFRRAFQDNFAPAMGIAMLAGYAGTIVSAAPFVALLRRFTWREALIGCGIMAALVWAAFLLVRLPLRLPRPESGVKFSFRSFLPPVLKRHNWFIFICSSCAFAVFYVLQTVVGKKFLEDYCGMDIQNAGWILAITGGLSAAASFCTPMLSKCLHNRRRPFLLLMGGGTLAGVLGILLAMFFGIRCPRLICTLLFVPAFCANMTPVLLALLSETNPQEQLGTCASLCNCLSYMLVALTGTLTGMLMDLFMPDIINNVRVYPVNSYLAVFGLLTLMGGISFAFSLFIRESNGKSLDVR